MEQARTGTGNGIEAVMSSLIRIIEEVTGDWETGFAGGVGADTRLIADLGFESIDVVHLIITLEEHFRRQDLPFEKVLMKDGRYVDDLRVGELAEFLAAHLAPRAGTV